MLNEARKRIQVRFFLCVLIGREILILQGKRALLFTTPALVLHVNTSIFLPEYFY